MTTTMDRVFLSTLQITARIGATAEERESPQLLELDVELAVDLRTAGRSNLLADTVNYADVAADISGVASQKEWILLENLAAEVSNSLLQKYAHIQAVGLEVRKFIVQRTRATGIRIWRER